jgi:hypothetical protein
VPAEFAPACGRPGTQVEIVSAQGVVRQEDCDLTSVAVVLPGGRGGAVVPEPGGSVTNEGGLELSRSRDGDVSYTDLHRAEGRGPVPGQDGAAGDLQRCAGGLELATPAPEYVGLDLSAVRAARAGGQVRVVSRAGDCQPHDDDLRPARLDVALDQDGRVLAAAYF